MCQYLLRYGVSPEFLWNAISGQALQLHCVQSAAPQTPTCSQILKSAPGINGQHNSSLYGLTYGLVERRQQTSTACCGNLYYMSTGFGENKACLRIRRTNVFFHDIVDLPILLVFLPYSQEKSQLSRQCLSPAGNGVSTGVNST